MNRFLLRSGGLVLVALLVSACDEPLPDRPQGIRPAAHDLSLQLASSVLLPEVGDTVIMRLLATRQVGIPAISSYGVRLAYDATRLVFLDAYPDAGARGLRMVNGDIPGEVRAAGAEPTGFLDDDLVTVRFLTRSRQALTGVHLLVDELRAADGTDLARAQVIPDIAPLEGGVR